MSLPFDPLTQSFYPDHCQYHGRNLTKVHSTTIEIFRFMTTKTSSPSLGTIILVCTVVAAALKVGTMRELSAKPQKMPHGETKQTIVEHQSSYLEQCLDGFP